MQWYDEIKNPGHNFNYDNQPGTGHFTQVYLFIFKIFSQKNNKNEKGYLEKFDSCGFRRCRSQRWIILCRSKLLSRFNLFIFDNLTFLSYYA